MTNNDFKCVEHSGICTEISNMKQDIGQMQENMNRIFMRINIILGGVATACLMLAANLVFKTI